MKSDLSTLMYKFCLLLSISLFMSGCATYGQKAGSMRDSLLAGQVGVALAAAEAEDKDEEDVLACLNKGVLRRMVSDYQGSNQVLEVAKQHIDDLYGISVSEQMGAVAVNDTLRSYAGDRYEQVLLHAYMAMNYIQMGDLDAARVEILQADVKMQEWGEQPEEDPFVRYFSGMIYEALGETDQAVVAYRQAGEIYKSTMDKQSLGMPQVLKADLLRSLASEGLWDEYKNLKKSYGMTTFKPTKLGNGFGELIVILNNGLAPVRSSNRIVTASGGDVVDTVSIAVPTYLNGPRPLYQARLVANGKTVSMETVENIDALARNALDEEMPAITARAIARAIIKHTTQKEAEDRGGALAGFLMTVTNIATEQGDTRSWTTLPQEIQLARLVLPKGTQNVQIEMLNGAGIPVDTISKVVNIKSGERSFVTEHWTSPNMVMTTSAAK
jgi:hypothetical protein